MKLENDKVKKCLEIFLCGSTEMHRFTDRAPYENGISYFDKNRKAGLVWVVTK